MIYMQIRKHYKSISFFFSNTIFFFFFSVHPSIIHGPPPYTEPGLDNKALQQSVDLVHDVTKNTVYGSQNDYNSYHTGNGLRPNGECKL